MLAFVHIPTGPTTNNYELNMLSELTAGHHLNPAG